MPYVFFVLYLATIPLSNWMVGNVGTVCIPHGPCLIPVWPWPTVMAPSGLVVAALALVLRDLVQYTLGLRFALAAILLGCILSLLVAPPQLALASAAAFLLSELLDTAVYTPLQRRSLTLAVLASGVVGLVLDSLVFLQLAFGSQAYLGGQVIGKLWSVLAAVLLIHLLRRHFTPARYYRGMDLGN